MPAIEIEPGVEMFYRYEDYTDPWLDRPTAVFLHGHGECSRSWNAWVPHLGRHFKIVRPDLRGWGKSTPIAADFPLSLDIISDDLERLLDTLKLERVHLVGSKIGGTFGLHYAATRPNRVSSLTALGAPSSGQGMGALAGREPGSSVQTLAFIHENGVEAWIRATLPGRLGTGKPQAFFDYWLDYMSSAPESSQIALVRALPNLDASDILEQIRCPTLIVASKTTNFARAPERVADWQKRIPNSTLAVVDDDGFHVAVSAADQAARLTLEFLNAQTDRESSKALTN